MGYQTQFSVCWSSAENEQLKKEKDIPSFWQQRRQLTAASASHRNLWKLEWNRATSIVCWFTANKPVAASIQYLIAAK